MEKSPDCGSKWKVSQGFPMDDEQFPLEFIWDINEEYQFSTQHKQSWDHTPKEIYLLYL